MTRLSKEYISGMKKGESRMKVDPDGTIHFYVGIDDDSP